MNEDFFYTEGGPSVELLDTVINKSYRFSGGYDPDDKSILHAMQNVKGVFVNACGIHSAPSADRMLARISVQKYHTDDGRSLQQGF